MSEAVPPPGAGAAAGGRAILFNATPSAITRIDLSAGSSPVDSVPGVTLFPATAASGTSTIAGCSFAVPVAMPFTITVTFDTGNEAAITTHTASTAVPALYVVAFLNGLVVVKPTGLASDIQFSSGNTTFLLA